MPRRDRPRQGPPSPRGLGPPAGPARVPAIRRRSLLDACVRRPLVHPSPGGARFLRRLDPGAGDRGRERQAVQGSRYCRRPRLALLPLRSRPRDVLAGRPIPAIDGGGLHLRVGPTGAHLGRRGREGADRAEAPEGREEGEVKMAATVQSKGGPSGAPPSYVESPAWRFLASLPVDRKLARYDVAGSIAHVQMLTSVGILTIDEAGALTKGLRATHAAIVAGNFPWREDHEDVHTNIEVSLTERLGPLGAAVLAGSTLPIDPAIPARILGFAGTFENSIDAVTDRDYFAEFLFDLSLLAVHLSSVGEEIVLWASQEFAFLRPAAALGSGSSLMPQKRNPDVAELVRGKSGRVIGDLVSLLTTLKGLPQGYNRDLQEDKAPVFDAVDHVLATLNALTTAISALEFDEARLLTAASDPRLLATDLAEHLVARGVPFREAHETVARYLALDRPLEANALRGFDPRFGDDVQKVFDVRASLAARKTPGGPSPEAVRIQLALAHDAVGLQRYSISKQTECIDLVDALLKEGP